MYIPVVLIAAALLEFAPAPTSEAVPVYKVEFNLLDGVEGKSHPSMHYSMLVDESRRAIFQAGNRVPMEGSLPPYVDTGVNIELAVRASEGKVTLDGTIELSSITGYVNLSSLREPIIAQRQMAFHTTVGLATPATIVDDPVASPPPGGAHQIEAVVTRVN